MLLDIICWVFGKDGRSAVMLKVCEYKEEETGEADALVE